MAQRQEEYRGYEIAVDAKKVGSRYRWVYTIDGGHYTEDSEAAPVEGVVLEMGMLAARAHVDRLLQG